MEKEKTHDYKVSVNDGETYTVVAMNFFQAAAIGVVLAGEKIVHKIKVASPINDVEFNAQNFHILADEYLAISIYSKWFVGTRQRAENQTFTYSSADGAIVSVSLNGTVKIISNPHKKFPKPTS